MCLIVHAPKGAKVPEALIQSAMRSNSNGWGIIYHSEGKTRVKKNLEMKKLIPTLKSIGSKAERLIHLRLATHGDVNITNCHPFRISNDLYMMHNGILHDFADMDKTRSDSKYFADEIVAPLAEHDPNILSAYHFRTIMSEFSSGMNKLAFMDGQGNVMLSGTWETDSYHQIKLSNTYAYDPRTVKLDKSNAYGNSKGYGRYASSFYDDDYDWSSKWAKRTSGGFSNYAQKDHDLAWGKSGKDEEDIPTLSEKKLIQSSLDNDYQDSQDVRDASAAEVESYIHNLEVDLDEDTKRSIDSASGDIITLDQLSSFTPEDIAMLCETEPRLVANLIKGR